MFDRPVQMQHLALTMLKQDAPSAALALAEMQVIHLIEANSNEALLSDFPAREYQQIYQQLNNRFKKIAFYDKRLIPAELSTHSAVSLDELKHVNAETKQIWQQLSKHEENIRAAKEKIHSANQLISSLHRFENLNTDLARLSSNSLFLKIFIGTIPHQELKQLQRALTLANTVIEVFYQSELQDYVSVITEINHENDIMEILKSAGFHEMTIPPELRSHPRKIKDELHQQLQDHQSEINQQENAIELLLQQKHEQLNAIQNVITRSAPFASLSGSLTGKGELVYLEGWVPVGNENAIEKKLKATLTYPFLLTIRQPDNAEMANVPSMHKPSRLLKPFQSLVNNFGIPEYAEIDPTKLFTLSYTLMFGMMFGDIGHGFVIILLGIWLRKKLEGLLVFTTMAGLSSMIFGFIYGSLFGYEHIIHPLWMSPMEDPQKILLIALFWGIGFLFLANLLSIRNLLAKNQTQQAILSSRGIAGMVFFFGCIFAGYQFMANQHFSSLELTAILLPLAVMSYGQWQNTSGKLIEKILIVIIEGLENIINTLAGTLSFLRIAAFSLNHVALATAVFTLANMLDTTGHWITIILGNIFIIVLEGGIVAIQCLRLEYYEGFSRFFGGKGRPFNPLKIETS